MPQKCRNYCWTLNNPTTEDILEILNRDFQYCIWGWEKGEEGTEHLQGYVEFTNQKRINEAKLCKRMHIEEKKGTQEQAIEYCKKDGEYYEFGTLKSQGKRNDILEMKEEIDNGANINDIAEKYFSNYMRYQKSIESYIDSKKKFDECNIYVTNQENMFDEIINNTKNVCVIEEESMMASYNNEEFMIMLGSVISDKQIKMLLNKIPITIKYGYQFKKILPKNIIIINKWLSKKTLEIEGIKVVLNASEVSGVILGPDQ